jgi:glycosyltransferase involved in cell wall biosynthesis
MRKVAFWFDRPQEYSGGLNYIKNLIYAISVANSGRLEIYVFLGHKVDQGVADEFVGCHIVRTSMLDRFSIAWFANRLLVKFFGSQWCVTRVLRRYRIDLLSHAEHVGGRGLPFKLISWIPDLQYLHLPQLFPNLDASAESERLRNLVRSSDAVVVSSNSARADLATLVDGEDLEKVRILRFVSQPKGITAQPTAVVLSALMQKYEIGARYFFMPNQFWRHKNHEVVFEAVRLLKEQGQSIQVVCTGNLRDYRIRDNSYVDGLLSFVRTHDLSANVRLLGLIPYADVLELMRNSIALINPSRFEGWSSTVEEARSMGKAMVLSDISVHREQDPPRAQFFSCDDASGLAQILSSMWRVEQNNDAEWVQRARDNLPQRTRAYGERFLEIVESLLSGESTTSQ